MSLLQHFPASYLKQEDEFFLNFDKCSESLRIVGCPQCTEISCSSLHKGTKVQKGLETCLGPRPRRRDIGDLELSFQGAVKLVKLSRAIINNYGETVLHITLKLNKRWNGTGCSVRQGALHLQGVNKVILTWATGRKFLCGGEWTRITSSSFILAACKTNK